MYVQQINVTNCCDFLLFISTSFFDVKFDFNAFECIYPISIFQFHCSNSMLLIVVISCLSHRNRLYNWHFWHYRVNGFDLLCIEFDLFYSSNVVNFKKEYDKVLPPILVGGMLQCV